jgi:hypothetical protein
MTLLYHNYITKLTVTRLTSKLKFNYRSGTWAVLITAGSARLIALGNHMVVGTKKIPAPDSFRLPAVLAAASISCTTIITARTGGHWNEGESNKEEKGTKGY